MNSETRFGIPAAESARGRSATSFILFALAGLVAGGAGWWLGEINREFAQVPLEVSSKSYQFAELNAATVRVNSINGALVYGGWGLCLAVAMCAAALICDRVATRPFAKGLMGILPAVALGALPSFAMMPLHASSSDRDPGSLDLTMPLLIHMGLWCPIGAGVGLAYGLACNGSKSMIARSVFAGILGAAIGAVAFEFLGAILMPTDKTHEPIAGSAAARLAASVCVAMAIAVSLAWETRATAAGEQPAIPEESVRS